MNPLRALWTWLHPPLPPVIIEQAREHQRVTAKANRVLADRRRLDLLRESAARAGGRLG